MLSIIKIVLIVGIIASNLGDIQALFGKSLDRVKARAKSVYHKSKFGGTKDKTWHFLGHDLSEYPGTNEEYRQLNQEKWQNYYDCLQKQNENFGKHLSATPEAVLGFEGGFISLECKKCITPKERTNPSLIQWYWGPTNTTKGLKPIEITEHILITPEDQTLQLFNLQLSQTGQYLCQLEDAKSNIAIAPYFVTVVNVTDDEVLEVHARDAPEGPHAQPAERVGDLALVLDTEWGEWSACSKCGHIGKKHRLGYCSVYLETERNLVDEEGFKKTETDENDNTVETISVPTEKIPSVDFELFAVFKFGIPCSSHILPDEIRELQQVKNRRNEVMVGYCRINCPLDKIFEVKDKNGKIVEKVNNSAGIYSVLQGLPQADPDVERRLQYEIKGKHITLTCPGNVNSDAPIQWQIAGKNVVPELIKAESKGRIYVSVTDRIHITVGKIFDSNVYSCWQQEELVGTIRLVIEKKLELNFNHHVMLFGIVVILSTFVYVYVKAFFGRRYVKIDTKPKKKPPM